MHEIVPDSPTPKISIPQKVLVKKIILKTVHLQVYIYIKIEKKYIWSIFPSSGYGVGPGGSCPMLFCFLWLVHSNNSTKPAETIQYICQCQCIHLISKIHKTDKVAIIGMRWNCVCSGEKKCCQLLSVNIYTNTIKSVDVLQEISVLAKHTKNGLENIKMFYWATGISLKQLALVLY